MELAVNILLFIFQVSLLEIGKSGHIKRGGQTLDSRALIEMDQSYAIKLPAWTILGSKIP